MIHESVECESPLWTVEVATRLPVKAWLSTRKGTPGMRSPRSRETPETLALPAGKPGSALATVSTSTSPINPASGRSSGPRRSPPGGAAVRAPARAARRARAPLEAPPDVAAVARLEPHGHVGELGEGLLGR